MMQEKNAPIKCKCNYYICPEICFAANEEIAAPIYGECVLGSDGCTRTPYCINYYCGQSYCKSCLKT